MKVEDFLSELKLNSYQKRVYLKLLEMGSLTAKQLCKLSGVPYGRIYDVLSSLQGTGLISEISSEPKTFKAIDPKTALKLFFEREIEEKRNKIKKIKEIELPAFKGPEKSHEEIIVLYGKDKFYEMLKEFLQSLKGEFLAVAEDLAHPQSVTFLTEMAKKQKKTVKIILSRITKENKLMVNRYTKKGIKIRLHPMKGLRLIIKDREEVLQSIVDPESKERISIYTKNKEYAKSMAAFFDSLWEKSKKV